MAKILITPKVNPDLDGVACALAYSELLKQTGVEAEGVVSGEPQTEVRYFTEQRGIKVPTRNDEETGPWEEFILVDASSMKGMPKVVRAERVMEVIDHRKGEPEKEFPEARIQNDLIGAAATLIGERVLRGKNEISQDSATLMYGAIFHNTLNFLATNTSESRERLPKTQRSLGINRQ